MAYLLTNLFIIIIFIQIRSIVVSSCNFELFLSCKLPLNCNFIFIIFFLLDLSERVLFYTFFIIKLLYTSTFTCLYRLYTPSYVFISIYPSTSIHLHQSVSTNPFPSPYLHHRISIYIAIFIRQNLNLHLQHLNTYAETHLNLFLRMHIYMSTCTFRHIYLLISIHTYSPTPTHISYV